MSRRIAITDIHGCLKSFKALLKRCDFDTTTTLYLLGDYIDRGPASAQVIDYILELRALGHTVHALRGNHEQMMIDAARKPHYLPFWLRNGGRATLQSFGVKRLQEVPPHYWTFLYDLPFYAETPGYLLVHAGLDFSKKDPLSDENGLMWIRHWYDTLDTAWLQRRKIIHGHTPEDVDAIKRRLDGIFHLPVLGIDAGCYQTRISGRGQLCAFDLDQHRLYFQPNVD